MTDLNNLVRLYFDACRTYVASRSDKVHIFVRVTDHFIEKHPVLKNVITTIDGMAFVILNIGYDAARDLEHHEHGFSFMAAFKGEKHRLDICYGDVIGMGEPGQEFLYDFATIPITGITGGGMALRPMTHDQLFAAEQERQEVEAAADKLKKRPKLVAVK